MPSMDNFNDMVLVEMEKSAVKVLKTHPKDIVDRVLYAINRVYVSSDPEEDTSFDKLSAASTMLHNIAEAIVSSDNPLEINYPVDEDGYYTGDFEFTVGTGVAKELLLTQDLLERSYKNRVKKAAKKFVQ